MSIRRFFIYLALSSIVLSGYGQSFQRIYTTVSDDGTVLEGSMVYDVIDTALQEVAVSGCTGDFFNFSLPVSVEYEGVAYLVTEISQDAFRGSRVIGTLSLPASLKTIAEGAFAECAELTAFSVDAHSESFCVAEGVLYDREQSFLIQYPAGKSDRDVTIPASVTDMGDRAFAGCPCLESVTFSNDQTWLRKEVFLNCRQLQSVSLPDSLKEISEGLFSGCESLSTIRIPTTVSLIGERAFMGCSSLSRLTIPHEVMTIGSQCFLGCEHLQWIESFPHIPPTTGEDAFSDFDIPLFVHYSSVDSYRIAENWARFSDIQPIFELFADDIHVYPRGECGMDIILEPGQVAGKPLSSVDFVLSLPSGFSVACDSDSAVVWELPEKTVYPDIEVEMSAIEPGDYHFTIRPSGGDVMIAQHTPLLHLHLCDEKSIDNSFYFAYIREGVVTSSDAQRWDLPTCDFSIFVEKALRGDVNYDGRQNVVDVMSVVNYILDHSKVVPIPIADINEDSSIDIVDVMQLIQLVLENEPMHD